MRNTCLFTDIFQDGSDKLDNSDEQRSESNRSEMIENRAKERAECSQKGKIVLKRRVDVLIACKVPGAERAGNSHLIEALNERKQPEEHKQNVDLRQPLVVVEEFDNIRVVFGYGLGFDALGQSRIETEAEKDTIEIVIVGCVVLLELFEDFGYAVGAHVEFVRCACWNACVETHVYDFE